MMLRGNLATRPFYIERLVSALLVVLALIALALTAYNATRLTALSSRRSPLRAQIAADEAEVNRVRSEAAAIQGTVDRTALQTLAGSTRLANSLITARTFSWTTFFGVIEDTIPMDVRITAVSPEIEKVASGNAGKLIVAKVSTERLPSLAQRFQVSSIPALSVFARGREINRAAGARPAAAIQSFVYQSIDAI